MCISIFNIHNDPSRVTRIVHPRAHCASVRRKRAAPRVHFLGRRSARNPPLRPAGSRLEFRRRTHTRTHRVRFLFLASCAHGVSIFRDYRLRKGHSRRLLMGSLFLFLRRKNRGSSASFLIFSFFPFFFVK